MAHVFANSYMKQNRHQRIILKGSTHIASLKAGGLGQQQNKNKHMKVFYTPQNTCGS